MTIKQVLRSSYRSLLIISLIIAYGIAYNLPQYFYIFAINELSRGNLSQFIGWQFVQFLIGILSGGLLALNSVIYEKYIQTYLQKIRNKLITNYYRSSKNDLSAVENNLVNNLNMIKENGADNIFKLLNQVSIFLFSFLIITTINFQFTLIVILLAICTAFVPKIMDSKLNLAAQRVSTANQKFLEAINSWISGLHELTNFNAFNVLSGKIGESSTTLEQANVKRQKVLNFSLFLNGLISALSQIIVMAVGGYLFFARDISLGTWVAANDFAFAIFSSLLMIINLSNQISSVREVKNKVNKQLLEDSTKQEQEDEKGAGVPTSFSLKNLSYSYDDNTIQYPNLKIAQGEKVLLVGPSGAGKTTLFKLLLGELIPKTGEVTFFDKENKKVKPNYQRIAYIPQKPVLFPDTIANNITMFNSELDAKVDMAMDEVALDLDKNSFLKDAGSNISGGQKQRIVLARSEIHDSEIVLLDEATSAIDQATLPMLLKQLIENNKALIMIEHNLSADLRKYFDRIIEIK